MDLVEGTWLNLEKDGDVISHQRISEAFFQRLKRFLELIDGDEESLKQLDKAIEILEKPKRDITTKLRNKILEIANMPLMMQEALMALPMDVLKNMESKIDELKIEREPGGDCLIITYGEDKKHINL